MNELEKNRKLIDEIDKKTAQLFEERMLAAKEIAKYKKERGLAVFDPVRETEVIKKNSAYVKNEELREYYVTYAKNVMSISKDYQNRLFDGTRVAYSGTEGAFAHIAAKKLFPESTLISCGDFEAAYRAVERGEYDYAVLPIENSYAGDVSGVLDLIFTGDLFINRVLELEVKHNLLGLKGAPLSGIKTVVSHPQALRQCAEYIKDHGFKVVEYSNTALAAKYAMELADPTVAAIASDETAENFGLEVLASGINSLKTNTTRFAVFSRAQHVPSANSKNENEHFILTFTAKNEAGALAQALNIIGAHGYNMRSLISRPMKELLWNYYFYVEADGNVGTTNGKEMLQELSAVCAKLKLAGTYN